MSHEIDSRFYLNNAQPPHFGAVTQFLGHPEFRFPLWYPALVFILTCAGALRLGRRFTLRSAIIATTVVAGLLGMAVGL